MWYRRAKQEGKGVIMTAVPFAPIITDWRTLEYFKQKLNQGYKIASNVGMKRVLGTEGAKRTTAIPQHVTDIARAQMMTLTLRLLALKRRQ